MHISFIPQRRDGALAVAKTGDALSINGTVYDFSPLPEGASLPQSAITCDWLAGDITRLNGALHLTLILPHGAQAPQETLFPDTVLVAEDGPVPLPPFETPAPEMTP